MPAIPSGEHLEETECLKETGTGHLDHPAHLEDAVHPGHLEDAVHIIWRQSAGELDQALEDVGGDLYKRQVVIDCRNKPTLQSAELSKLIQVRRRLLARDCTLEIRQVLPGALEILHLTRLDRLFDIRPAATC